MNKTIISAFLLASTLSLNVLADEVKRQPNQEQREQFKQHMKNVDTDRDHKISHEEYMARANQKFDRKDINKDGYITKDEAKQNHERRQEHREQYKANHQK